MGNLTVLFIEATSLGASASGIPLERTSGSSMPMNWEPLALAYHIRKLTVSAELGKLRRKEAGDSPVVRNLRTIYKEVTSLRASSTDIPQQEAGGAS